MSYEDARKKLLSIAGEYKVKTSLYKLEDITYHVVIQEIKDTVKEILESLSLPSSALTIDLDRDGKLHVAATVDSITITYNTGSLFMDYRREDIYVKLLEDALRGLISVAADTYPEVSQVIRIAKYADSVLSNLTDKKIAKLTEKKTEFDEAEAELSERQRCYRDYSNEISNGLTEVSVLWFREKLAPGMKVYYRDYSSNDWEIITVHNEKEIADLDTKGTALRARTCYMNNQEFKEIADTIDWDETFPLKYRNISW